ncbi:MAG: hypothetical protein WBX38_12190 [Candidatus Sulfotelmatobacter sp.]
MLTTMLRAHSLLWHYLWLAPDILQVTLAVLLYRRGLHKSFPVFFTYAIYEAIETFTLYSLDVLPFSAETYWRAFWVGLIVGGLLKFAVIGELLFRLLRPWAALAETGNRLLWLVGGVLTFVAVIAASRTTPNNPHWLIGSAPILQQTLYIVQSGLILFVFIFAFHYRLTWERSAFGIAIGFALVFSQHLACWAVMAGLEVRNNSVVLTFLNMATYHVCVLIWFYYLLVPQRVATTSAVSLPENNLAAWNRELERLLQP